MAGSAFLCPGGDGALQAKPLDVLGLVKNPQSDLPKTLIVFVSLYLTSGLVSYHHNPFFFSFKKNKVKTLVLFFIFL